MDADVPTPPDTDPAAEPTGEVEAPPSADQGRLLDLDAISADLDGVEMALTRLGDGTYWTDEVTGEPLPDELLATSPTARQA